jgi:hypothetical protein
MQYKLHMNNNKKYIKIKNLDVTEEGKWANNKLNIISTVVKSLSP